MAERYHDKKNEAIDWLEIHVHLDSQNDWISTIPKIRFQTLEINLRDLIRNKNQINKMKNNLPAGEDPSEGVLIADLQTLQIQEQGVWIQLAHCHLRLLHLLHRLLHRYLDVSLGNPLPG